jgi:D-alanyl-D-alanine dipeptidase
MPVILWLLFSCSETTVRQEVGNQVEKPAGKIQNSLSKTALEQQLDSLGLLEIREHIPTIRIDLKYATADNFTGKILYRNLNRAYLHPFALSKLVKAQALLKDQASQYSLLIYDAARPLQIQREMYEHVKNTPYRAYVAPPERNSLHNYGMAVDITVCDAQNMPLDMGTPFDYFGAKAGINNEQAMLANGSLTLQQVNNRQLLREVMQEAGFIPIRGEWWHFNACSLAEAGQIARLIE